MLAHRLALSTAAATVLLIVFGGLVTNTGAALAVPDWPNTFGHNMFLFPWSGMVGGVFYEHSHRLLGALVGLLTVGSAVALWPRGRRLRLLGVAMVAVVVAQGVIGGLRVVLMTDALAMVHGPLAQAFFALVAAVAFVTSRSAERPLAEAAPLLRRLALVAVAALYAQIILGALLTHAGWLWLHVAGAAVVFAILPIVTARARRSGDLVAKRLASVLLALLIVQLVLGIGAFVSRFSGMWIPGGQLTMLVLPVSHRLVGGLLLAAAVVLAIRLSSGVAAAAENGPSASLPRSRGPAAYAAYASAVDSLGASHLDRSRRPISTVETRRGAKR